MVVAEDKPCLEGDRKCSSLHARRSPVAYQHSVQFEEPLVVAVRNLVVDYFVAPVCSAPGVAASTAVDAGVAAAVLHDMYGPSQKAVAWRSCVS